MFKITLSESASTLLDARFLRPVDIMTEYRLADRRVLKDRSKIRRRDTIVTFVQFLRLSDS